MSRERIRSRSRIRTRILVAALIVSVVTLSFLGALIVPLYTYPGVSWTNIINAKQANPGVAMVTIINPNNGPGASKDQNYVTGINNLRAAGVVVLGYDHTSYAARPLADVEADINSYKSWYNVSGIFFDEMSNVPGNENYYSILNQYSKSAGLGFTVGNPGANTIPSYVGTLDVIVTYENQGVPNTSSLAAMTLGMPKSNFAVIAYGVDVWNGSSVSNVFNYADYVYVTPDQLPNPYGTLTADWSKLVSLLSTPSPNTVPLTVASIDAAGTPIVGLYATVTSASGAAVASGFTPLALDAVPSTGYVVTMSNNGRYVFSHWDDGSTNPTRAVSVTQSTTLTASFALPSPTAASMTIQSVTLSGAPITGLITTVVSNGNTVETGTTPLTFTGTSGAQYTISVGNSASYAFSHWDDGTTNPARTATLSQNTTLSAYFGSTVPATSTSTAAPMTTNTATTTITSTITSTATTTITSATTSTATTTITSAITVTITQISTAASSNTTGVLNANTFAISAPPSQTVVGGYTGVQIGFTNTYNLPISSYVWAVARDQAGQAVGVFLGSVTLDSGNGLTLFIPTLNLPTGDYSVTIFATTTSFLAISQSSVASMTIP
jgi:Spherulation-specific family 4